LVALFIVAEIVMLGVILWFRQTKVKLETTAPLPPAAVPALNTQAPEAPIPNLPKPEIAGRLNVVPPGEHFVRVVAQLNADAQNFRQNGDFSLAETALRQGLELDPAQPQTLANMAMLQEALGRNEKALEYWKSIIGRREAGARILQLARDRAALLQQRVQLEQQARQREMSLLALKRQIVIAGVKPAPPSATGQADVAQVDFTIRREDRQLQIDPGKMRIQLFFYDQLGEGRFAPARKLEAAFVEEPDWRDGDAEVLRARYPLSRDGDRTIPYGYLLRVYYNNELQDECASPAELLRIFPSVAPNAE
jgi:tetratricopeptide (TPR) repeat protein